MDAVEWRPQEPGLDDIRPAVADAPPSQPRAAAPAARQVAISSSSNSGYEELRRLAHEELRRADISARKIKWRRDNGADPDPEDTVARNSREKPT